LNPSIGFVLLTHENPAQILFLCEQLSKLFDRAPIVVHHDFGKCTLNTVIFPKNVRFVEDWASTRWGGWGVVAGQMKAMAQLYSWQNPDWFVVLSGSDFPIKPTEYVLDTFYGDGFDAYLYHRPIGRCRLPIPAEGFGAENFSHPAWERLAFERYVAIGFGFYKLATRLKWRTKAIYLRQRFLIERFTPFDGSITPFAGDYWLSGNRRAAEALLEDGPLNRKLIRHFQRRPNPDEGFLHTVLCNASGLRISQDNKRFTDWEGQVNHPRILTRADYPRLLASSAHFARKFDFHREDLEQLSAELLRRGYAAGWRRRAG
jgi:hypothetical protein